METNSTSRVMGEIDLRDLLRTIVRHWVLILVSLLVVLTAAFVYLFTATRVYLGTARILIDRSNPDILSPQDKTSAIEPSGQDFYQTQYKILESRAIARNVINRLHLEKHPEYEEILAGKTGNGKQNPPAGEKSSPGDALSAVRPEKDSPLVDAFLARLKIQPVRNSRIVEIGFESIDPRLAALGANTVAQAYIDWNLGLRVKSSQSASHFLEEQVKQAKAKMEASEQAIQQYREKHGLSLLAGRTDSGRQTEDLSRQRLSQISAQLVDAANRRIEAEIKYRKAADLVKDPGSAESIPEVATNPIIISLKDREVQMIREKTLKAGKYGPKHPEMVALTEALENIRTRKKQEIRSIVDSLQANYDIALKHERSLRETLQASENEKIGRDKIAIQFQVLQQAAESNRQLYDLLLKRLNETSVSEESRTVNIHVVDRAELSEKPVRPKKMIVTALALVLGLLLGVGLAFFRASWTAR